MIRGLLLAVLALTSAGPAWAVNYLDFDEPIAAKVSGTVQVIMPGSALRPLKQGETVPRGSRLDTKPDGELVLALHAGIAIKLAANTQISLAAYRLASDEDPEPGQKVRPASATIQLYHGALFAIVNPVSDPMSKKVTAPKLPRELIIYTPVSVLVGKDGTFGTAYDAETQRVSTLEGEASVITNTSSRLSFLSGKPTVVEEARAAVVSAGQFLSIGRVGNIDNKTLVEEGEPTLFYTNSAAFLMETISLGVNDISALTDMAKSAADVMNKGNMQAPVIQSIAEQLAGLVAAGRISPAIAGEFIRLSKINNFPINQGTYDIIERAILNAPAPQSSTPPAAPTAPAASPEAPVIPTASTLTSPAKK